MNKILLIGATGQVGWELCRTLMPLGKVVAVGRRSPLSIDLTDPEQIRQVIRMVQPQLIVNAAAYTAVDRAETEPALAHAVNAIAPGVMAEVAKQSGAALVHYSTDYVFDGTLLHPYREDDEPHPLSVYGKTKLAGEQAIQAVGVPHLILRTSWVYGLRGENFLLKMLKLAQEREELRIVNDQMGAPTWSRAIAAATAQILAQGTHRFGEFLSNRGGLYHLTAAGKTSWYGFADAIFCHYPDPLRKLTSLVPIPSQDYPTPARRPTNSVLSHEKLYQTFGLLLPDWEEMLRLAIDAQEVQ